MKKDSVAVLGAGSWGTALAMSLASAQRDVRLWARSADQIQDMKATKVNRKYLPDVRIDDRIVLTNSLEDAISDCSTVVFAVPAQHFRGMFEQAVPFLDDGTVLVNVAKGIERGTLLRMSEIARILRPDLPFVALSGPSHAEEVCIGFPTTIVAASEREATARFVQDVFMTDRLRVYTNNDVVGVEIGGALKNIVALAAGISDGIGYGDNAKAALMTRGLVEMKRLGLAIGAKPETFAGLTGVGDLIVTCTSMHSRNRRCGILIGQGVPPREAVRRIGMAVEGMETAEAAKQLARRSHVEMPITECLCRCIDGEISPQEAVDLLMGRSRKSE